MLRIIDANLNRCCEGLRILEEVSRFILNDDRLTTHLKSLRHSMVTAFPGINIQLLNARSPEDDPGASAGFDIKHERKDLTDLILANSRRVQESLRVLEEFSKFNADIDTETIKSARFSLYQIEKDIISRIIRLDKVNKIKGLYLIVDPQFLRGRNIVQVTEDAIKGGVSVIQLRDKQRPKGEVLKAAKELCTLCKVYDIPLIINDYVDIAISSNADGVHVGQTDLPVSEVRKMLSIDKIIGCSATTLEEAKTAQENGADYIGVGAIYPTDSKQDIRYTGIENFLIIKSSISIPLVAIGGIKKDNIYNIVAAGADAAAVISAILNEDNIQKAVESMISSMKIETEGE
ncbi:MAG: thiamine phosphate synthase [Chloroflexi bacterium]|nr:thiamine phosphate synthase [Chloroflexota bacterium]